MDMLTTLLAAFFVALSFMSAPSTASHQLHNNLQNSLQKAVESDRHVKFTSLPSLPRKLQLNEDQVKSSADKNTFVMPQKDFLESSSGTKQHENEETTMHKTRKEGFEEGPNKSEYFNMDYMWVRKKRPIHN